jgi:hypothetical protein
MSSYPKNFPVFPVAPYPGDDLSPPLRGNTGIGVREYSALVILHALLTNPNYYGEPEHAVPDAFRLAEKFHQELFK